ncbi:hypothetical protein [Ornithinibacillus scapharcae]|uniref:hypothetical protein n=1 Tax=Ornithinibacillus scapharcae TaxID=1147159 RepID=UPI000225BD41|nr:hypothetical protein [Ornithinibacillus scapharcae]
MSLINIEELIAFLESQLQQQQQKQQQENKQENEQENKQEQENEQDQENEQKFYIEVKNGNSYVVKSGNSTLEED